MALCWHSVLLLLFSAFLGATASTTVYGEECGSNPMKHVLMVAKKTGHTLTYVLEVLRNIDPPAFQTLTQQFRMYAACVGLVDTGYFKKRSSPSPINSPSESVFSKRSSTSDEPIVHWLKSFISDRAPLLPESEQDVDESINYLLTLKFDPKAPSPTDTAATAAHQAVPRTEGEHDLLTDSDLQNLLYWQ